MKLQLAQQTIIKANDNRYPLVDRLCWLSKNLYNQALYQIRQQYSKDKTYLGYNKLYKLLYGSNQPDYFSLPYTQCAQQVLHSVDKEYVSFFKSIKSKKMKGKRVHCPKYKNKDNGRYTVIYTNQCAKVKDGILKLKVGDKQFLEFPCDKRAINQVIYTVEVEEKPDNGRYGAIDLGIDNICSFASNATNAVLYDGKKLKSINQHYNKRKASLQSKQKKGTTKRIRNLTSKRNRKVKDYMHKLSRAIVQHMEANSIATLIVGKNAGWKDGVALGHKTNQKFVFIPYSMLVHMLEYKCRLKGIRFILVDESYTSKCSFLDGESIKKHLVYKGKRTHRGLFVSSDSTKINADTNAACNIIVCGCVKGKCKCDVSEMRPACKRFVLNPVRVRL